MSLGLSRPFAAACPLVIGGAVLAAPVTLTHSASMTTTHGAIYCGNSTESNNNGGGAHSISRPSA